MLATGSWALPPFLSSFVDPGPLGVSGGAFRLSFTLPLPPPACGAGDELWATPRRAARATSLAVRDVRSVEPLRIPPPSRRARRFSCGTACVTPLKKERPSPVRGPTTISRLQCCVYIQSRDGERKLASLWSEISRAETRELRVLAAIGYLWYRRRLRQTGRMATCLSS